MTPEMMEVRRKLFEDFEFYATHALKIRTKKGEIAPFSLNQGQIKLLEAINNQIATEGKVRIVCLKGRQMGISTVIGGWLYWWVSQHTAQKAIVVTHKADSTQTLFDLTKRYYDNTPEILKPSTKYSSRKELSFGALDSSYMVATAGGDGIGRAETLTQAHCSELAFWPKGVAKENFNGLMQAIPNADGTAVFIESTANGLSGLFYDMWTGAVNGENGFMPVFLPWFWMPEYRESVPASFERTPEEEKIVAQHGLDDEQLMFRRIKVAQSGLELFQQEYPLTPEEAFITSGSPVFNLQQLTDMMADAVSPVTKMNLVGETWEKGARGELTCYFPHDPGETYYIGADVAMGIKSGDYSVAQVLNSRKEQVATYRAHVHPDHFATVLYHLGMLYNEAKIIVESNNHGILTCNRLGKDLAYPNFYTEESHDKLTDTFTVKLGFNTNTRTKPLIIDQLRGDMREGKVILHDKPTIREMMTFVVNENGQMVAETGSHDDTVMSLALVNHIHEGYFEPIAVLDSWYIEGQ
jgi:hypothetical protein